MNIPTLVGIVGAVLAAATIYIQSLQPESRLHRLLFSNRGNAAARRGSKVAAKQVRPATEGPKQSSILDVREHPRC